jgi:ribonuclease BN (tRNA processing enzyme)
MRTKVVLLGTGTPVPDPERAGPATAIVVDDGAYLIDFGPGVVRRAKAARGLRAYWRMKSRPASSIAMRRSPSPPFRRNTRSKATDTDSTDTPDRSVVISGDSSPTEETINACNGCDVLIHEARAMEMFARLPEDRRSFGAKNHTTSEQLTTGGLHSTPDVLQNEIASRYRGQFVVGRDLDVY